MPAGRRGLIAGMSVLPVVAIADPARISLASNATVGLIAGGAGSTDARIAEDLATVTGDAERLRVLPMLGLGSIQNIADLVLLKGVDVAIVHEDALTLTIKRESIPREASVQYIAKLFPEEIHVLARNDIARLEDLNGKVVSVGPTGSGTELTASRLLEIARVTPAVAHLGEYAALDELLRGTIAAMVVVGGKPVPLLQAVPPSTGLRFLTIPLTSAMVDAYLPAGIEPTQYPAIMASAPPVETVAVGSVLAAVAAAADTQRAKRVNRFVTMFFSRFDQFRRPGFHPKWQEVNLAAQLPGWTRYPQAENALHGGARKAFDAYLRQSGQNRAGLNHEKREALFQQFLRQQARRP